MSKPFTFDRMCRILITLVIIAGAVYLINVLRNVLLPFCLACLIAYILEPAVEFCMDRLRIKWRIVAIL
ncbi:MAG: AI-2E family transporter, partial [Duncaniella sp.]|nr:AI-2E family transporter [Duncaniella sp.]